MLQYLLNRNLFHADTVSGQIDSIIKSGNADKPFQINIPVNGIRPGWYFIEIELSSSQTFTGTVFTIKSGNTCEKLHMPLKGGRKTKRLAWFKSFPDEIIFDLAEPVIDLKFARFSFKRTITFKAHASMMWILFGRKIKIKDSLTEVWEEYNKTFISGLYFGNYKHWIESVEGKMLKGVKKLQVSPPLSIIIYPCYTDTASGTDKTLKSIRNQSYANLDVLVLQDRPASDNPAPGHTHSNIKYINNGNSALYKEFNSALRKAAGEICVFMRSGDILNSCALANIARHYQPGQATDILFGDDDQIDSSGTRSNPRFKPSWNPPYFYCYDYISNFVAIRKSLLENYTFAPGADGFEVLALILWCVTTHDLTGKVIRVPYVLTHQNRNSIPKADPTAIIKRSELLQSFFNTTRQDLNISPVVNIPRLTSRIPGNPPKVSIIIPTKDNYQILKICVTGILEKTDYKNFEIVVINNQSKDQKTLEYFKEISNIGNVRVIEYDYPFNYSAINNFGASVSEGELICLLNDDTEPINPEWLSEMVSFAVRPEIGCVGAKLYYSNNIIQHGGVILGLGDVAGHSHRYFPGDSPGYMNRLMCTQYVSAVTGACLLVRKSVYNEMGGLDEKHLTVAYNDVDFCIRVSMTGYINLWTPHARLFHYESLSRGADNTFNKKIRYFREVRYMRKKWKKQLLDDPYYHPHLTDKRENYSLRF